MHNRVNQKQWYLVRHRDALADSSTHRISWNIIFEIKSYLNKEKQ